MQNNNPFGNLNTDNLEEARDNLGGGGGAIDSGVYTGKIKLAYAGQSDKGAKFLAVVIDINGRDYRETLYVTNKNGENYYTKADKKIPLPGFVVGNDLALLSTGQPLSSQDFNEKVVSLYNFEEKKELPTKVNAVTSMMGKEITIGVLRIIEDKSKKNDSTGAYEPTGETREVNNIDKVFNTETKKTVSEYLNKQEAEFIVKWGDKHTGVTQNRAKNSSGTSGVPGQKAAPIPAAGKAASKSLFGG